MKQGLVNIGTLPARYRVGPRTMLIGFSKKECGPMVEQCEEELDLAMEDEQIDNSPRWWWK